MALAPEWMSYTKEVSSSQGSRILGRERERERSVLKYGRHLSHSNLSYASSSPSPSPLSPDSSSLARQVPITPFACSVSSPPAPPHAPSSILGDPPSRVLNRSKSSPGFGSKSSKPKKSPDRNFSNFNKPKPKPPKPSLSSSNYKSLSQPNLFNNEKTANWHQQKLHQSSSSSSIPTIPSPLATSHTAPSPPPPQPPSTSPPPPSSSSPPPEIDKLKQLIPTTGMPPKSVRARVVVGPPLPLTKKPPPSTSVPPASTALQPSPSTSSVPGDPPATLAAYFRKATSEPSLMHHKVPSTDAAHAAVRRDAASKKARAMEFEKTQMQLLKEAVGAKQPKRSNFFQHLIKKEELGEPMLEDDTPIGADQATTTSTSTPPPSSPPLSPLPSSPLPPASPSAGLRSPLPEDMEDEERFLRTLGWVPDEEDPVPILAEEEIADVRVKIILSKQRPQHDSEPMSIDVK